MTVPNIALNQNIAPVTNEIKLHDRGDGIIECVLDYSSEPKFTVELLSELAMVSQLLDEYGYTHTQHMIFTSSYKGAFSLGGDLTHFITCIKKGDKKTLKDYADLCLQCIYNTATGFDKGINTVSVISGNAFGGGFEAALSCDYIIAEEGSKFGFPETLFNLFPGMGAHILLGRKVDFSLGERIISSGNRYDASKMYEMGIIDMVVPAGQGYQEAFRLIRKIEKKKQSHTSLQRIKRLMRPISYQMLEDIADIWVENALNLDKHDLRLMEKIARTQCKQ